MGRGVVGLHRRSGLWVAEFFEGLSNGYGRLCIDKECSEFGLCRGGHDGADNLQYIEDGAVVFWNFFVAGHEHVAPARLRAFASDR